MGVFLILSSFLSVLLILLFVNSFWKQQKRSRSLPPGPPPLPLLGNPIYVTRAAACKYYPELSKKYGPVFTIWKMTEPIVVLCGYEVVKDALVNHSEEFSGRPVRPTVEHYTKGYSFMSGSGYWRPFRRFLLTSLRNFGMGKRIMEEIVQEEAEQLISAMSLTKGKAFNSIGLLGSAVNNIVSSILFGERFEYHDRRLKELILAARRHANSVLSLFHQVCNSFPILMKLPVIRKKLYKDTFDILDFVRKEINHHREKVDLTAPRDLIDSFLAKIKEEEGNPKTPFNETSILTLSGSLFAAATETTSSTLKFCLSLMTHYPDIQEKVQREIDEVIGPQRLPGIMDRAQLPYTNAVIHECQRVLDLAPIGLYRATTTDTQFRGFTLPKGTTIIPFLSSVLSDPTQWETPEDFNPGQFLDSKGQFQANPAFMAFSAGKRACLGEPLARLELFLFFTTLLQRFTFRLPPGSETQDWKSLKSQKAALIGTSEFCAVPRSVVSK
ncbi:cytochrome P450 2C8-like [Spea bombifrons]|uniref:cytochrome P450 2C8-like n=1 Tax=Spea bombifrons TaxID=233779 RepID=UPI0023493ABE|nr:cytochrome P450 2C8-like [Spea bombifrons]